MAASEELFKIVLDVLGVDGIESMRKTLAATKGELTDVKAAYERGEVSQEDYLRTVMKLAKEQQTLQSQIQGLERAMEGQAAAANQAGAATAAAMGKVGKEAGNASYKLMQMGQFFDDLQYVPEQGLRPILGQLMGFAPALGMAVLAIDQVVKHTVGGWGNLFGVFTGQATSAIDKLKAKVDELEKKKLKLPVDQLELDQARAKLEAIEKLQKTIEAQKSTPTEAAATQQTAVRKAVAEGPQGELANALLDTGFGGIEQDAQVKAARERVAKAKEEASRKHVVFEEGIERPDRDADAAAHTALAHENDNLNAARQQAADRALGNAESDPKTLDAIIRHMQANPDRFARDLPRFMKAGPYRPDLVDAQQKAIDAQTAQAKFEADQEQAKVDAQQKAIDAMGESAARDTKMREESDAREEARRASTWDADEEDMAEMMRREKAPKGIGRNPALLIQPGHGPVLENRRGAAWRAVPAANAADVGPVPIGPVQVQPGQRKNAAWRAAPAPGANARPRPTPADELDQPGGPPIDLTSRAVDAASQAVALSGQTAGQVTALAASVKSLVAQTEWLKRQVGQNNGRIRGMNPQTPGSWVPYSFMS